MTALKLSTAASFHIFPKAKCWHYYPTIWFGCMQGPSGTGYYTKNRMHISFGRVALFIDLPRSMFKEYKLFLIFLLLLPGCVGLGPSVMGKSNYKVDFIDIVSPDGTQTTEFHSSISAPAGDIATIDPGAKYIWENGEFVVSGKGNIDSTRQADLIETVNEQNIQIGISAALNALLPLLKKEQAE